MSDTADWERVHHGVFSPPGFDLTSIAIPFNQQPPPQSNGIYQDGGVVKAAQEDEPDAMESSVTSVPCPSQLNQQQQQLPNHSLLQDISQQPYHIPHLSSNQPFSTFGVPIAGQRSVPQPLPQSTSSGTVNPVLLNPKPLTPSPALSLAPSPQPSKAAVAGQKRSVPSSRTNSPAPTARTEAKKQKPNDLFIDLSTSPGPTGSSAAHTGSGQSSEASHASLTSPSSLGAVLSLSPVIRNGTLDGYVTRDAQAAVAKVREEVKESVKEGTPARASPVPLSTKPTSSVSAAGPSKPKTSTTPSSPVTMSTIRALVTPSAFKTSTPIALFKLFWAPENGEPPFKPSTDEVMEVVVQIWDHAPEPWLKKMGVSQKSLEVWYDWLVEMRAKPVEWQRVMMPVFEIFAKTEISAEYTKGYKIAILLKRIVNIAEEKSFSNAGALKAKYAQYQAFAKSVFEKQAANSKDENVPAKRKIDTVGKEDGKENGDSSSKRPATSSSAVARPVSKTATKVSSSTAKQGVSAAKPAVKPAASKAGPSKPPISAPKTVSDMSFFSAPSSSSAASKPKAKASAAKPAPPPAVSAASSLLKATLETLNSKNAAAKADAEKAKSQPKEVRYTKSGRVIRTVKFRDAKLEEIKYFTAEPWEAQIEGGTGPSVHAMDMDEGRALAKARNHGTRDWYEPSQYVDPSDGPPETAESLFQSARERGVLAAQDLPGVPISNPSEDGVRVVSPYDNNTRTMQAHHPAPPQTNGPTIPPANLEDLLRNLADIPGIGQLAVERQPQYPSGQYQPPTGHVYPVQAPAGGHYPNEPGPSAPQQDWSSFQNSAGWPGVGSGHGHEDGRSKQGKTKSKRKGEWQKEKQGTKKCKYFASGNCPYGNNCNFAHY